MAGEQSGSPVTVSDLLVLRDDLSEIKVALADLDSKIATLDTVYRELHAEINDSFKAVYRHIAAVTVLIERNASSTPYAMRNLKRFYWTPTATWPPLPPPGQGPGTTRDSTPGACPNASPRTLTCC